MKSHRNISYLIIISVLILISVPMSKSLILSFEFNEKETLYISEISAKIQVTGNMEKKYQL